jgi:hypothetical protein
LAAACGFENNVHENDLYDAMDWLLPRQPRIEKALAARLLTDGSLILYDLTSSYFEGTACPLAKLGYSRDGKKERTTNRAVRRMTPICQTGNDTCQVSGLGVEEDGTWQVPLLATSLQGSPKRSTVSYEII